MQGDIVDLSLFGVKKQLKNMVFVLKKKRNVKIFQDAIFKAESTRNACDRSSASRDLER